MEMDDQVGPLTPEQEAQADAEFADAFNNARGDSRAEGSPNNSKPDEEVQPDPETQDNPGNDEAAQVEAQAAAQADAAQAEADAPVTLTKKQLDELHAQLAAIPQLQEELRKTRDTTAGKLGSIQQQMQALADKAAAGQKPAMRELKRIKAEFPELGQMLEEDLNEAIAPEPAVQQQDSQPGDVTAQAEHAAQPPADPLADERVQQVLRQKDLAIVDAVHPDWRNLRATPEFNEWRSSLPPAAQELLASTWDANVLVDAIKDFKTYREQRATKAQAQADASKQRGKRLADATPATTGAATGRAVVDDDAEFEAGFKAVRGGRG